VREVLGMKLAKRPILIALTGVFTKSSDEIVARTAGFDHFVRKGDAPDILLGLISEVADRPLPPAA